MRQTIEIELGNPDADYRREAARQLLVIAESLDPKGPTILSLEELSKILWDRFERRLGRTYKGGPT